MEEKVRHYMVNLEEGGEKMIFKPVDCNISECRHNPIESKNKFSLLLKYLFAVDPYVYLKSGLTKCAYCGIPLLLPQECFQLPINIVYLVCSAVVTILSIRIVSFLDAPKIILTVLLLICYYSGMYILIRLSLAHIFTFCKWRSIDIKTCEANFHSYTIEENYKNKIIQQRNIISMGMFLAIIYYMKFSMVYFVPVEAIIVGIKSIKRKRTKLMWLCGCAVLFTVSCLIVERIFTNFFVETLINIISAAIMISLAFVEDWNR